MSNLLSAKNDTIAKKLMQPVDESLNPDDDQEKAVYLAIRDDKIAIPVVNKDGALIGAVTAHSIIDVMHDEHVEDTLITAGIRGKTSHIVKLVSERSILIVKTRAPWLMFGLAIGLGLGFISSLFEDALKDTVAIAYFIPVVAYIADSVGTQSEAIAVRALATIKINYWLYLIKEFLVGILLGAIVGALGGLGAALISKNSEIGFVVALALFVACTIAAVLASATPMIFKLFGKDPALGSGPLATALQDAISVTVYFSIAMWLL